MDRPETIHTVLDIMPRNPDSLNNLFTDLDTHPQQPELFVVGTSQATV